MMKKDVSNIKDELMQSILLRLKHLSQYIIIGTIIIVFAPFILEAIETTVTVSKALPHHILSNENSSIAYDPTRTLGIGLITSSFFADTFQALEQGGNSIMTESAVWWRITINNQTKEACFLHLHSIGVDTIDVYVPTSTGGFHHLRFGHLVEQQTGKFINNDWQVGIELPELDAKPSTIYIRKVARYAIFCYASVGTSSAIMQADKERSMFNAAFLGLVCALIFYNLFIYISLRSKSYLFYLCYIGIFLLHHVFMMGKLYWLFGTSATMIIHQYGLTTLTCLVSISIIWFSAYFLQVRRYAPTMAFVLEVFFVTQIVLIAIELFGAFYLPTAIFFTRQLISFNVGLMSILCILSAIVVHRCGNTGARFFLLGWTLWTLTIVYLICMTLGVIPTTTFGVYHLLQIGAASEMLLMSIALADRINTLRGEKESALRESNHLIEEHNLALERRVTERTAELKHAYDALVSANQAIQQQVKFQNIQNDRIQKKNHQLEQQNKQLHSLNEERSNLLGIVAHDLKNPLASIIFAAESTRHFLRAIPPKEVDVEERFLRIESAAERMHGIITNLLSVHTLETGQIKIVPEKFDIVSLVQGMVEDYTEPAAAKYIQLHFRVDDCIHIHSDRSIIAEILDNLISNAIKYSPSGRNVYVSLLTEKGASSMAASAYSLLNGQRSFGERYFLIAVSDEGPGMTEEDKAKLFTKFAKLSAQPTGGESSTGLGLAIVKKFVELLRGSIWCESEYGVGTTFYVTLPMDVIQHNQQYN